jgi:hypothetical protein
MGFVRGEPIRLAPVKVLVPPFAMVCWGSDEWVLWADSAPSLATPVGPLPRQLRRPRPLSAMSAIRRHQTVAGEPRRTWQSSLLLIAEAGRRLKQPAMATTSP